MLGAYTVGQIASFPPQQQAAVDFTLAAEHGLAALGELDAILHMGAAQMDAGQRAALYRMDVALASLDSYFMDVLLPQLMPYLPPGAT